MLQLAPKRTSRAGLASRQRARQSDVGGGQLQADASEGRRAAGRRRHRVAAGPHRGRDPRAEAGAGAGPRGAQRQRLGRERKTGGCADACRQHNPEKPPPPHPAATRSAKASAAPASTVSEHCPPTPGIPIAIPAGFLLHSHRPRFSQSPRTGQTRNLRQQMRLSSIVSQLFSILNLLSRTWKPKLVE